MVLRLKLMGKLNTSRKIKVLDIAKVLHGPRTQTYGETRYFQKNLSRFCMVLVFKPMGKLITSRKI